MLQDKGLGKFDGNQIWQQTGGQENVEIQQGRCRLALGLCQSLLLLLTLPVKVAQHGICYTAAQANAHTQKVLDVKDDISKDKHAQPCSQDVLHLACSRSAQGLLLHGRH